MATSYHRLPERTGKPVFDMIWFWSSSLPERKGDRCRVVRHGALNSVLVEFKDGERVVTSRYAVRKFKPRF